MKKSTFLFVPASFLVCAGAYAQSSVTLYGLLDAGVAYVSNSGGSSVVKFSSGNTYGSRWGLKGSEDLGGGLKTVFQLENGYSLASGTLGQGGREFGRKAIVGLSDDSYGAVTIGRQYDPIVDVVQPLTEDAYFGGTFGTPGDVDNYDNSVRVSNSIKYVSPLINGLQAEALLGLGGVAGGGAANGQTLGLGLNYAQGPLALATGYYRANGGNTTTAGIRTFTSSSDSIFSTNLNTGFASAKTVQIARAGGTYSFGNALVGLSYSNVAYKPDGLSDFTQTAKFNVGGAFFNYRLNPALLVGLGYNYTKLSGQTSADYQQVNLGVDYALSKRTSLYALTGYEKASGKTLNASGAIVAATAVIGDYGVNSNHNNQSLVIVGIRHRF